MFSKKINSSGVVIASKYDVSNYDEKNVDNLTGGEKLIFTSEQNDESGWSVLKNGKTDNLVKIPSEITLSKIINILLDNNLLK